MNRQCNLIGPAHQDRRTGGQAEHLSEIGGAPDEFQFVAGEELDFELALRAAFSVPGEFRAVAFRLTLEFEVDVGRNWAVGNIVAGAVLALDGAIMFGDARLDELGRILTSLPLKVLLTR